MKKTAKRFFALALTALMLISAFPFSASAVNSYWGYTDYNVIENKGAPADITSYSTKVTRKATASTYEYVSEYLFECTTDAGKLYYTLQETQWGTFNLGMMYLVDNNGTKHQFVEGYTDWEYVYRVKATNGAVVWSGGNHGNEALVSLELYNGETGAKLNLSAGQSATCNVIHIIEKTKLLKMPDLDGSSVVKGNELDGWTENDVYAHVTRKYTITGPQIKLNVDYKYVSDAAHNQSYTCMFPITKKYGLYCDMYDRNGGFIKSVITPEENSNYSGSHNSGNYATRALIYGKNNSQYQFDVRVNTLQDSLEGQINNYRTAFWDMSTSNKLYFTKYPMGEYATPTITAGTEYHTECVWMFRYVPEGRTPVVAENVALNKKYTITNTNTAIKNEDGSISYGALLTDGVAYDKFNSANDNWFALWNGTHTKDGIASVTIDLVSKYKLSAISLNLCNQAGYGVSAPSKVEAFVRTDNTDFVSVGTFTLSTGADAVYTTELPVDAEATQVRIDFAVNAPCSYVNEIKVFGTYSPSLDSDNAPLDNLIRGLHYNISVTNEPVSDSQWGTYYRANLTDGVAADKFDATNDSWFIYSTYKNVENGKGTFTVDLGKKCDITKLRLHLANVGASMGVKPPKSVEAFALIDGEYTSIGKFALNREDTVMYWTALEVKDVQTSSIKIEFNLDGSFAYVNEVEVHGTEAPVVEPPVVEPTYIKGDVNNDGKHTATDYLMVKKIVFDTLDITEIADQETAMLRCDCSGDGKITATDYFMVKRLILS